MVTPNTHNFHRFMNLCSKIGQGMCLDAILSKDRLPSNPLECFSAAPAPCSHLSPHPLPPKAALCLPQNPKEFPINDTGQLFLQ